MQDEGSQLVALALAAAPVDGPDRLWVDLCAGPGGKAALLAVPRRRARRAAARARGAAAPRPARPLVAGCATVAVADGRQPAAGRRHAPTGCCSTRPAPVSGRCAGGPRRAGAASPADLPPLTRLQGELLAAAVAALRPGGVLAYVTCSPHLAETVVPVADVLRRHPELEQLDARPLLPGVPDLGDGPAVQLWPHRHGTDAMFLALLAASA